MISEIRRQALIEGKRRQLRGITERIANTEVRMLLPPADLMGGYKLHEKVCQETLSNLHREQRLILMELEAMERPSDVQTELALI
jgi:hypothetical protein